MFNSTLALWEIFISNEPPLNIVTDFDEIWPETFSKEGSLIPGGRKENQFSIFKDHIHTTVLHMY